MSREEPLTQVQWDRRESHGGGPELRSAFGLAEVIRESTELGLRDHQTPLHAALSPAKSTPRPSCQGSMLTFLSPINLVSPSRSP